ncbi:MAG: flavodoxin domain-containing protein [Eubacteriales bacterium]|nr:flavodoxin domain-containing protein [Eubacteriales bacterium]MDD3349237.1 flavodoxin domain-containing protein [Eubacteriales bacterium]
MKTLIAYGTKYGCTKKIASLLSEKLSGEVDLFDLSEKGLDLSLYDTVLIGGPLYAGRVAKQVSGFCKENMSALKEKRLGFFLCGMGDEETARKSFEPSFTAALISSAVSTAYLGGAYDFSQMNFPERFIVKKISGCDQSQTKILEGNITSFAEKMNSAS